MNHQARAFTKRLLITGCLSGALTLSPNLCAGSGEAKLANPQMLTASVLSARSDVAIAVALAAAYETSVTKELDKKKVEMDKDAEKKVKKLLDNGAKEVAGYGAPFGLRQEANVNVEKFARELVKNAESSNGRMVVTKKSVTASLRICPLWPICK